LFEAVGVRRKTLPWTKGFKLPAVPQANIAEQDIWLPDFFALIRPEFYARTALWTTTSLVFPLFVAYFYNLTLKRGAHGVRATPKSYQADPLIYNLAKALTTWLVYAQGFRFYGLFSDQTVADVNLGFYGGYQGVLISSFIGAIVSLYAVALK
jgi:hypothetical protein